MRTWPSSTAAWVAAEGAGVAGCAVDGDAEVEDVKAPSTMGPDRTASSRSIPRRRPPQDGSAPDLCTRSGGCHKPLIKREVRVAEIEFSALGDDTRHG